MTGITTKLGIYILSLTPAERWQAMRWMNNSLSSERWFIAGTTAAMIALVACFIIVTYSRTNRQRKAAHRLFFENAERMGLSRRERQILLNIATKEKLNQVESIFSLAKIFERGAAKIARSVLAAEGPQASRRLNAEISVLRDKLGFRKPAKNLTNRRYNLKPDSRQIPEGKTLHITPVTTGEFLDSESVVKKNEDLGLTIETSEELKIAPGESLTVRYYFGASIWEFDSTVLDRSGKSFFISHSENVRFVNRRRFLRVPVKKPAYIAAFPFARQFDAHINQDNGSDDTNWGPPKFMPADIIEMAGPGLRVLTTMQAKTGDRVIVGFKLSGQGQPNSMYQALSQNSDVTPSKIVEDIGLVRHCKAVEDGFSIAIELTGLTDDNLCEMIKATNAASIKNKSNIQEVSSAGEPKKDHKAETEILAGRGL